MYEGRGGEGVGLEEAGEGKDEVTVEGGCCCYLHMLEVDYCFRDMRQGFRWAM